MVALPSRRSVENAVVPQEAQARPADPGASPPSPPKPRLLDRGRGAIRARHYSHRTEDAYVGWIKRYIFFHDKRHPAGMGAADVTRFLTSLAVDGHVAASTRTKR